MQSMRKDEVEEKTKKLFQNFAHSYLGIGRYDLLQIRYVDSTSWGASLKITFFVFLSIYSGCDATASWATQHTTMCLDYKLADYMLCLFFIGSCVKRFDAIMYMHFTVLKFVHKNAHSTGEFVVMP